MAEMVEFELVSPEKLLMSEAVEMVVVPAAEGDIGVLPGHAPLIATVRPGVIDIFEAGKVRERIFVAGGFCEVTSERCTMLAEQAEPVAGIDKADAEAKLAEAKSALEGADEDAKAAAEAALKVAEARLIAAGGTVAAH